MIVDPFGRQFKNLRVSLTAACNYACTYCVPKGEKRQPAKYPLTAGQLSRAVKLVCEVTDVDKLRITGGEPLVAPHFDEFLECVAREHSFSDVSLTTNGQLLQKKIPLISAAGIKRINVSLDTLDARAFRSISGGAGDLDSVLAGIEAALAAGLAVKLNTVPLRRANIDQIMPLLDYCLERGIELRFIELMRMGHLANSADFNRDLLSMDYILREIGQHYEFCRTDAPFDSTSIRFEIPGKGVFGIIANESEPFCSSCTRLRLSSSGYLHGCLSSDNKHYIGDVLELPEEKARQQLIQRLNLAMADKQTIFRGGETVMRLIGG